MQAAPDEALRRDIRLVTSILGQTLVRAEGQQLFDLVELVREQAKRGRLVEMPDTDLATTTKLVRAFTVYFHLANVTEQVHRGRALLADREHGGGWLERALDKVDGADVTADELRGLLDLVAVRPVFTAHPTEVARRSTIDKLRSVAAVLEGADTPRRTRRLEEAVQLLWHTDELRAEAPEPVDEARNGVYYLEGLSAAAVPDVLEELRDRLAERDVELPITARPLRFGTWMGGDRDGNPNVTRR